MRNKKFISHATPDDNYFAKWLSLKFIGLGYDVWCDVHLLDRGADSWKIIEKEEIYDFNWFSIISFPKKLRFHSFEGLIPKGPNVLSLTFPAIILGIIFRVIEARKGKSKDK